MKQINWGVIGVGNVTEKKSAPVMYKIENSNLVAVMRRDEEKVKDYAQRHNVKKWYTNADELINDPEVNAIYIATPPVYHKEYALKVAQAGKPCYIEKPMATNYQDCVDIVKVFEEKDLPLFVAYYRTCLPNFIKVKELIDHDTLGDIRCANIYLTKPLDTKDEDYDNQNWRVNPKIAGDGYFYDLGSHQLNILEFLLGEIADVQGIAKNQAGIYASSDIVTTNIEFKNGVIGTGFWCFSTGVKEKKDILTIIGSKATLTMATFDDSPITITYTNGNTETLDIKYPEHAQQPLITHIVSDLLNNEQTCYSNGQVGAKTNFWLEKISDITSLITHNCSLK